MLQASCLCFLTSTTHYLLPTTVPYLSCLTHHSHIQISDFTPSHWRLDLHNTKVNPWSTSLQDTTHQYKLSMKGKASPKEDWPLSCHLLKYLELTTGTHHNSHAQGFHSKGKLSSRNITSSLVFIWKAMHYEIVQSVHLKALFQGNSTLLEQE